MLLVFILGSGLGRHMAQKFAGLGCKLVLWDINTKGNDETAELVAQLGAQVFTYQCDLSSREDIYDRAKEASLGLTATDSDNISIVLNLSKCTKFPITHSHCLFRWSEMWGMLTFS